MTKKKSRKEDEEFQLKKSKSINPNPPISKNRGSTRTEKERKQPQTLPVFNKMVIEDRKAYEEKYRENLVAKRIEQQKRGFRTLRYDMDANSEMADIDEDSVNNRNDNETIKQIKELLQEQEMMVNRHRCQVKAKNQLAKVEKLSESVYDKQDEYREIIDRVKPEQHQKLELGLENSVGSERNIQENEIGAKSIMERIGQLESVYY